MNNSQSADNRVAKGIAMTNICYMDHTLVDIRLVFDIEEKPTDSGPLFIRGEFVSNDVDITYVFPNYDEPVYDSNRPDSPEDSPPLT